MKILELKTMNSTEYKTHHESYMQNNHGTTAMHTFFCIFFTILCCMYTAIGKQSTGLIQYVFEYLLIVLPLITAHTILSSHIYLLNLTAIIFLYYKITDHSHKLDLTITFDAPNIFPSKRISSITILRGLTYLITVCCILAVDFQIFPRHLAKTESFGYSLMDTGVGLFVTMSGLVHKDVRKHKLSSIMKSNAKFFIVLIFLGIARFVSVKQLDYHEHVTEYGVHWNFFFTLAVCKLVSTFLLLLTNYAFVLSIVAIVAHEFILFHGLQEWVFSDAPRTDFFSANREGISSCLGYVSVYLFAVYVKSVLSDESVNRYFVIMKLIFGSILHWAVLFLVSTFLPTSRILANAGYCLYLDAVLLTILAATYFLEVLFDDEDNRLYFKVPLTLVAINDNGLIYFLVANLLTGAINLAIKTLFVSSTIAFITLNNYMIVTIALAVYFNNMGLKI